MAKELDPTAIIMTLAGINIDGLGEDQFVSWAFNSNSYETHVSAKGEVTRVKIGDESGRVTFTLGQSSSCNDRLSALAIADRRTGGGQGALLITDLKGTTLIKGNAWIEKIADGGAGKSQQDRSWVVFVEKMFVFLGGSTFPTA
jgi:hypothetical protein